jgi:hypothetical protein
MTGYDTAEGYQYEPFDDRDEDDPEFVIDPMFSGTQADGDDHRKLRHRDLDGSGRTPADQATFDPTGGNEA